MQKVSVTGIGASAPIVVRPGGSALMFTQVDVVGTITYHLEVRASPDAAWLPSTVWSSPQTASGYGTDYWAPEVRLVTTAGTGTATLYITEALA